MSPDNKKETSQEGRRNTIEFTIQGTHRVKDRSEKEVF